MKTATDRFAEAIEAAEMIFGMLRTYILSVHSSERETAGRDAAGVELV